MSERLEPWIDKPYQPLVAISEPGEIIKAEFGQFTKHQREWFLRRDTDPETGLVRCQFQGFTQVQDWVQCPMDEEKLGGKRNLHAHHIVPQGWWEHWFGREKLGEEAEDSNQPWNGILLCAPFHHNGERGIHPDYWQAKKDYKFNQESFREVAHRHHELIEQGIPYWNAQYDQILFEIAKNRTEDYLEQNPHDQWPKTKGW